MSLFLMIPPPRPVRRTTGSDSISVAHMIPFLIIPVENTIIGDEMIATAQ